MFFNKSQNELIRSIFLNRANDSIIVVSVTKKDDFQSLKCRTVTFKMIEKAFANLYVKMPFAQSKPMSDR